MWRYVALIGLAFAADRLSKRWAFAHYAANGPTEVLPWLTIEQGYNTGIALGLFQGIGPLVGWLSVVVVMGLFIYLWRTPPSRIWTRAGLAVLIGASSGNLVDRVIDGRVLDFLATPFPTGLFNVADVLIYVGFGLILAGNVWPREAQPEAGVVARSSVDEEE